MHLTLKKEATKPAPKNVLQKQARVDQLVTIFNQQRRVTRCGRICLGERKINLNLCHRRSKTDPPGGADAFSGGKKDDIRKEGLHYTAVHPDLRTAFISRLPTLPFRCYVVLRTLASDAEYYSTYLSLIRWTAGLLFRRCDRHQVTFSIEQNPRVTEQETKMTLANLYQAFTAAGLRRPLTPPQVDIVSKMARQVAIPDFMLAVLGRFVQRDTTDGSIARLQFERLRDRYSLIFNLDTNTAYDRRNPFDPTALSPLTQDQR